MATLPIETFANDTATATLASDPGSGGTTLTLTTGQGVAFPTITSGTNQMRVRVDNEIMLVTAHGASADTMTVTRGIEGTTGAAHAVGSTVNAVMTAEAVRRWSPDYAFHPRQQNLLAWNMAPPDINANMVVTSQTVYYGRMYIPENMTITGLAFAPQAVGTGYSNSYVGLYTGSGSSWTRQAVSAESSASFSAAGVKRIPFTSTYAATGGPGVFVLVAFVFTYTGGSMTIRGMGAAGHSAVWLNASDIYYWFAKETLATALPTTTDPTTGTTVASLSAVGLY
jgi:hypothetical protein